MLRRQYGTRKPRGGTSALTAFISLKREAVIARELCWRDLGTTKRVDIERSPLPVLILHNPPALRQIILRQFGWWNLWLLAGPVALQIPKDLDSLANAKTVRAPAIFLLADNDEVIAPRFQRLVVEAYAGEKRVIALRGAYHNDPLEGAALVEFHNALDWLLPPMWEGP